MTSFPKIGEKGTGDAIARFPLLPALLGNGTRFRPNKPARIRHGMTRYVTDRHDENRTNNGF
jgi:hypothetical protein